MKIWLHQHLLALIDALGHLRRAKGSFSLNVVVIAIALALPFAGLTLMENLRPVTQRLSVQPAISVFLPLDAARDNVLAMEPALQAILKAFKINGRVTFVSRESALATLKEKSSIAAALDTLGDNPLPDAYLITLDTIDSSSDAARIDPMIKALTALPGIEQVQLDSDWVKRLAAMLQILRVVVTLLASTLSVVVIAVAFNTIRLQVLTQHAEIDVARIVGATDRFIYRPFYYTGAMLGIAAALLGLAAVALALIPLNQSIADFARLYASDFRLVPLEMMNSMLLVLLSALLGLAGSALSVRQHLKRAE
jgi:cell division transport system permease protein